MLATEQLHWSIQGSNALLRGIRMAATGGNVTNLLHLIFFRRTQNGDFWIIKLLLSPLVSVAPKILALSYADYETNY